MRALLIFLLLVPTFAHAIEFPDSKLEAALRGRLGIQDRPLTTGDLAALTELKAFERGISDLTGLEHATSLEVVDLECNDISDLSPLAPTESLTFAR